MNSKRQYLTITEKDNYLVFSMEVWGTIQDDTIMSNNFFEDYNFYIGNKEPVFFKQNGKLYFKE